MEVLYYNQDFDMAKRSQTYVITIAVLEGRHYSWLNMDSAVVVNVCDKKRTTAVKNDTDSPFYNEYFVFEFFTTHEKIAEENISLTVIQPANIWRKRKILGYVTMDIATVWSQKNHQFYHKWAILSAPKTDVYSGPRGYLKVDICILVKGESPKVPLSVVNDEIEGNLLLPKGPYTERQKASYIFDIYRCLNLIEKPSNVVKDNEVINEGDHKGGLNSYVEITFAGISVRTSIKKNTSFPVFNERLTITDLFPPLCQRIKIEICYADSTRKSVQSIKYINLRSISNEEEDGFLPTLGPIFLDTHGSNAEYYAGSILLSISTELGNIDSIGTRKSTLVQSINSLNEQKYFKHEDLSLFGCIFDVSSINKRFNDKALSIRITFGRNLIQKSLSGSGDHIIINSTVPQKPRKSGKNQFHLKFEEEKECLWIFANFPYIKHQIYNFNILLKIFENLKTNLEEIYEQFENLNSNLDDSTEKITEAIDYMAASSRKYLDIVNGYNEKNFTKLDKERKKLCIKEMKYINEHIQELYSDTSNTEKFRKLTNICRRIELTIENIHYCLPDIYLWMIYGKKKVAFAKIESRKLVYSPVTEERGCFCGVKKTICFYANPNDPNILASKIDVILALCQNKYRDECMNSIPGGFEFSKELVPKKLIATEKHIFRLNAYIFEGQIKAGFDKTGLADPFVRVVVGSHVKETKCLSQCLTPVWDEVLIFENIFLYGTESAIELIHPMVLVEVFDKDVLMGFELIGRTLIKPVIKFSSSEIKVTLKWQEIYWNQEVRAEILSSFELVQVSEENKIQQEFVADKKGIIRIPVELKPKLEPYRIEVFFWGMRRLRKICLSAINRPRISVISGNEVLDSDIIDNVKSNPNFPVQCKSLDLSDFAEITRMIFTQEQDAFILMAHFRSVTRNPDGVGAILYNSFRKPLLKLLGKSSGRPTVLTQDVVDDIQTRIERSPKKSVPLLAAQTDQILDTAPNQTSSSDSDIVEDAFDEPDIKDDKKTCFLFRMFRKSGTSTMVSSNRTYELLPQDDVDSEDYDWWTKFFKSVEEQVDMGSSVSVTKQVRRLKVYPNELESQPEFQGFTDILQSFELYKGRRTGDDIIDEENITAVFKGSIKIYRWPIENYEDYVSEFGLPLEEGAFQNFPDNAPLRYLLRVYCVRGLGMRPKDLSGKSDPYLRLTLNEKIMDDKDNVVMRNINPIFGRCFEFDGTFPHDSLLKIAVWDYDVTTANDLIGETEIDLENRYYTKHRASCGIPETYEKSGYCFWRDQHTPTIILADICKRWNLETPEYEASSIRIGAMEFVAENFSPSSNRNHDKEVLALTALRRWNEMPLIGFPLVPEHVETRSLYHPSKPGIEQGKLQLWIDILPTTDLPPVRKVDIVPRKPIKYELRVIIWNVENVVLGEDDFFGGERKSDIYVKGWLTDSSQAQYTDVHYRSLNGEGNFNWRFVFCFEYLPTENMIVLKKKETLFATEETEIKIPCKLTLQVWDNDTFSKDDFLGNLTLELSKLQRGAKLPKKCDLSMLEIQAPKVNLFKLRRTKGWWPFHNIDASTKADICTGKVEAEIEILTAEEALKEPAGLGRNGPQGLPHPKRADTSFSWIKNPLKAIHFVYCRMYRRKLIITLIFLLIVIFVAIAFYAFPGYMVKKILGAK